MSADAAGRATIYHNPRCSKSRQALDLLRERGVEPTVVKYIDTPPTVAELRTLISDAGLTVRQAVRVKEAEFTELGLLDGGAPPAHRAALRRHRQGHPPGAAHLGRRGDPLTVGVVGVTRAPA